MSVGPNSSEIVAVAADQRLPDRHHDGLDHERVRRHECAVGGGQSSSCDRARGYRV